MTAGCFKNGFDVFPLVTVMIFGDILSIVERPLGWNSRLCGSSVGMSEIAAMYLRRQIWVALSAN